MLISNLSFILGADYRFHYSDGGQIEATFIGGEQPTFILLNDTEKGSKVIADELINSSFVSVEKI